MLRSRVPLNLAAILVVAFVVRLIAAWWWHGHLAEETNFVFGDSETYWHLGQDIASGRPYEYDPADAKIFRTPGYPAMLSPIFLIGGDSVSTFWGRLLSVACGTLAVGGTFWLGTILFNQQVALVAAAIAAIYPENIAASILVLSEAPFGCVLILQLGLWSKAWKSPASSHQIILLVSTGLLAAMATLIRPSWLLFTPFAIVLAILFSGRPGHHARCGSLILLGLTLGMLPWWVRNYQVSGHFVPTTLQVGASLYDGLSPRADGSSDMRFVPAFTVALHAEDAQLAHIKEGASINNHSSNDAQGSSGNSFEYRLDHRLRRAALTWAGEHPGKALRLARVKFFRMWNIWPNEASLRRWPLRLVIASTYVPVMMLAAWGIWHHRQALWPIALLWLPGIYFTLLHIVFVSSIRYRQPVMIGLILLAATALSNQRSSTQDKKRP